MVTSKGSGILVPLLCYLSLTGVRGSSLGNSNCSPTNGVGNELVVLNNYLNGTGVSPDDVAGVIEQVEQARFLFETLGPQVLNNLTAGQDDVGKKFEPLLNHQSHAMPGAIGQLLYAASYCREEFLSWLLVVWQEPCLQEGVLSKFALHRIEQCERENLVETRVKLERATGKMDEIVYTNLDEIASDLAKREAPRTAVRSEGALRIADGDPSNMIADEQVRLNRMSRLHEVLSDSISQASSSKASLMLTLRAFLARQSSEKDESNLSGRQKMHERLENRLIEPCLKLDERVRRTDVRESDTQLVRGLNPQLDLQLEAYRVCRRILELQNQLSLRLS